MTSPTDGTHSTSPFDEARRALEQSEVNHSPAIAFRGPAESLDRLLAELDLALTSVLDVRPVEIEGTGPGRRLYRRGGRRRWFGAQLLQAMTTQGGMQNVSYHVLLECVDAGDLLLTVHGVRRTLYSVFDPHEVFGAVLTDLSRRYPDVTIGPWFHSSTLPEAFASSPAGFARWVGTARSLGWT